MTANLILSTGNPELNGYKITVDKTWALQASRLQLTEAMRSSLQDPPPGLHVHQAYNAHATQIYVCDCSPSIVSLQEKWGGLFQSISLCEDYSESETDIEQKILLLENTKTLEELEGLFKENKITASDVLRLDSKLLDGIWRFLTGKEISNDTVEFESNFKCDYSDLQTLKFILDRAGKKEVEIMARGDLQLAEASYRGNFDLVKFLLDYGVHPNGVSTVLYTYGTNYGTPILGAFLNGHKDIVELFLQRGVNGQDGLDEATKKGNVEMIALFKKYGYVSKPKPASTARMYGPTLN